VRVAFDCEDHDAVLTDLCEQISPRILRAPARLDRAATELEEYFTGRRDHFDVPLDLRTTPFRARVLSVLATVGYGHTLSYTDLAAAVGSPRAVRAVGSACATNPLPLLLPCHRVIRSDGSLGGYRGGHSAKQHLLALERPRHHGGTG
jgi:methylated-DNA-[protein]-cysteine S-methyltransferase